MRRPLSIDASSSDCRDRDLALVYGVHHVEHVAGMREVRFGEDDGQPLQLQPGNDIREPANG